MLKHRIVSGVLMSGLLLAAIFFFPPWAVFLILMAVCALALLEFYALLDANQIRHFKVVGTVSGLGLVAVTWLVSQRNPSLVSEAETMMLFASMAAIFFRQISYKDTNQATALMAGSLLGILYVAFLFNSIVKILALAEGTPGRLLVLYLAAVVKFTDMGAYFVGCAIGRHKLIPRISPAKSWEGLFGGILAGVGASFGFLHVVHHQLGPFTFTRVDAAVLGVGLAIAGVIGDLIESVLKRAAGVKDSGRIIQGMGGILDVLDSLLFAAPLLYLYLRFFL